MPCSPFRKYLPPNVSCQVYLSFFSPSVFVIDSLILHLSFSFSFLLSLSYNFSFAILPSLSLCVSFPFVPSYSLLFFFLSLFVSFPPLFISVTYSLLFSLSHSPRGSLKLEKSPFWVARLWKGVHQNRMQPLDSCCFLEVEFWPEASPPLSPFLSLSHTHSFSHSLSPTHALTLSLTLYLFLIAPF